MANTYALIHGEEGAFGISFPDFPGAVSGGATVDEAIERGRATLAFHIAGMLEDGEPLPTLRSLTEIRADAALSRDLEDAVVALVDIELPARAVRVNVSIDEQLLAQIDRAAGRAGKTRSAFLAEAARARLKGTG